MTDKRHTLTALLLAVLLTMAAAPTLAARETYLLGDGWRFFFAHENSSDRARTVRLPHTWNTDALTGEGEYRRTTANYSRTLYLPAEWSGKRLFVRFGGVQSVADVFVNGHHVGSHAGGRTAFAVELTGKVRFDADNTLRVVVSNASRSDLLPASTEENIYGGIYRDVELIVTEPTAVSPLYYGTEGVMVHPAKVSSERAEGVVAVALTGKRDSQCTVALDIIDPDGYVAGSRTVKAKIDGKLVKIPFTVENPALWSPASPALYSVRVAVGADTVSVTTGFRDIKVTPADRFRINGRHVQVRGVVLHHDRQSAGAAISDRHLEEDLQTARGMGANAVRSFGAPHADRLYGMCNRQGIIAWVDVPFVQAPFLADVAFYNTEAFRANGREQLREIILQNCNHPSVAMWGIFSNIRSNSPEVLEYVRELNALAKSLDPSRPTVACSNHDGDINLITDLIVWQQNVGWDKGSTADLVPWQRALSTSWNHLAQAVSYGDANLPAEDTERSRVRPTLLHEGYIENVDEGLFWGVWINSLFDFGSARYHTGVRHAGLVGFDHRQHKDAYYLYRTRWNAARPTLHILGKHREVRGNSRQVIRIYSSQGTPKVTLGGEQVAVNRVAQGIYATDTLTLGGQNTIRATVGNMSDSLNITIGNFLKKRP